MKMDEGVEKIETTLRRFFEYQRRRIIIIIIILLMMVQKKGCKAQPRPREEEEEERRRKAQTRPGEKGRRGDKCQCQPNHAPSKPNRTLCKIEPSYKEAQLNPFLTSLTLSLSLSDPRQVTNG
jgi:hypothetical protein